MYLTFTPTQGCGTVANEGNILDFEVNIKAVNPPEPQNQQTEDLPL